MALPESEMGEGIEAALSEWRKSLPNERLAHLVRDAERHFKRSLQLRLSEHNISFGHWAFLRILWERDGLTQRQLSALTGLMEPTTHSAILRLQELGLVKRSHKAGNRKKLFVYLTDRGRALKDVLVPLAEDVNREATVGIADSDLEVTRRTLLALIDNLARDEAAALERGMRITATRDQNKMDAEQAS